MINLALKNIKEKKLRNILAIISIAIGTASIVTFLGLSAGIQQASFDEIEKANPLTQITVHPNNEGSILSLLSANNENRLNQESLEEISSIPGIKKIHTEIQYQNFASVEASVFGMSLVTDAMILGVPGEFIEEDIATTDLWNGDNPPYPALIPRKFLDLYNFAVAAPQGLPPLSEDQLLNKRITLYPNNSTFFPNTTGKKVAVPLKVVGFSDKINLIGITLPSEVVENLNELYAQAETDYYLEFFVETQSPDLTTEIAQTIEDLGYRTQYLQKNIKSIESKFAYLTTTLGIISLIILLTAAIAIINTFLATVTERTKEIGLLRAIGATKSQIKSMILTEAAVLGIIGSLSGVIIGVVSSLIINQIAISQLATTTLSVSNIFHISPGLIIQSILFGIITTILSAYLPARKAANLSPIKALTGR